MDDEYIFGIIAIFINAVLVVIGCIVVNQIEEGKTHEHN